MKIEIVVPEDMQILLRRMPKDTRGLKLIDYMTDTEVEELNNWAASIIKEHLELGNEVFLKDEDNRIFGQALLTGGNFRWRIGPL